MLKGGSAYSLTSCGGWCETSMKERISLEHGEGGELTHRLIRDLFVQYFGHTDQAKLDAALILLPPGRIAFTTDTFVVKPPFFQGEISARSPSPVR